MKVLMLNGSWNNDGSPKAGLDEMARTFAEEGVENARLPRRRTQTRKT
ncbi:MAG: hypothetical protein IKF72_08420 [Kiritimatiellae bacterium]|nr:hypothetical protein [Kiritimatiellia bacterium]